MAGIPDVLLPHSCTVEPFQGRTGNGVEVFGAPIAIAQCMIDTGGRQLVRANAQGGTGDEQRTPASIYVQLDVDTSAMTVRSRVRWDLGAGPQEARVDQIDRLDARELPVPSHTLIKVS